MRPLGIEGSLYAGCVGSLAQRDVTLPDGGKTQRQPRHRKLVTARERDSAAQCALSTVAEMTVERASSFAIRGLIGLQKRSDASVLARYSRTCQVLPN